jgi:hypothetical protein
LQFINLAEEQHRFGQVDVVLPRDVGDDVRRVEEPIAVVFPESDVVSEVVRDAPTDGIDGRDASAGSQSGRATTRFAV